MKSKLEIALEEMDSKADILKPRGEKSKKEILVNNLKECLVKNRINQRTVLHDFMWKTKQIDLEYFKMSLITIILENGVKGFLKINQDLVQELKIESGFTAFEEIAADLMFKECEVSPTRLKATKGYFVYEIHENGMLNLIESIPDSSD